ncbi:Hypothetical predicted protein [Octopus vulgaris]|uniref:Uncharacterized protein n=1 Tax=Octopus vulgaris TaxID=6645 RepID=A0AA36FDL0_OCTVU|nr:Hypothetical predicted protein [Octopus vulgaris]
MVRWISKGNCLKRFMELFDVVSDFLSDVTEMNRLLTVDGKAFVSYSRDIFEKLNVLTELRGLLSTSLEYQKDRNYVEKGEHLHAQEPFEIGVEKVKENVCKAAVTAHDPPRRILQDAITGLPNELAAKIGSGTTLKRTVFRRRRTSLYSLHQLHTFVILESLQSTFTGDNFILHDSGISGDKRIIIFGINESLTWLKDNC